MSEDNFKKNWPIHLLIVLIPLLFLVRFLGAFRFPILILLSVVVLFFLGRGTVLFIKKKKHKRSFLKSTQGQVQAKLGFIQDQLNKNKQEIEGILSSISDLKKKEQEVANLSTNNQKEWQELMRGFQGELELRKTKNAFFETCTQKLGTLLKNHTLAKDLEEKRKKLESLKENNYEELAKMEELRYDVESDILYLDTVDQLSKRLLDSSSIGEVKTLKKELEEMTKNIREL